MKPSRLIILDLYRGLAAFLVMIYHFQESFNTTFLDNILVTNGHIFTDYFFVLSGFVIHYSYISKNYPFKFLLKRFNRVYPLLFSVSLVYFIYRILGNLIVNHGDYNIIKDIVIQFLYSIFLLNSTPVLDNMSGTIGPSWSISGEIIAYIVYALCMGIGNRDKSVLLITIISLLTLYILGDFYFTNNWGFVRTIFGFNLGVIIANNLKRKQSLITLFLVLIISLIFWDNEVSFGAILNILFALLIKITASIKVGDNLFNIFELIGKYSFGFYLWHRIVINVLFRTNLYFQIPQVSAVLVFNVMVVTIFSTILSYMTYQLIETKVRIFKII